MIEFILKRIQAKRKKAIVDLSFNKLVNNLSNELPEVKRRFFNWHFEKYGVRPMLPQHLNEVKFIVDCNDKVERYLSVVYGLKNGSLKLVWRK